MSIDYRGFWLELLKFGENEEERQQNWNYYCRWKLSQSIRKLLPYDDWQSIMERLPIPDDNMEAEVRSRLLELTSNRHDVPADDSHTTAPLMSFWRTHLDQNESFAGRLLIGVEFREAVFKSYVDFSGAILVGKSEFGNASFNDGADFSRAEFRGDVSFNNSKFLGTTLFWNSAFWRPPKFFEAELHEDVTFTAVKWNEAEKSYMHKCAHNGTREEIRKAADDAMRAWGRLALIMSQREKLPERHEFFRLKMRAQRQRDGLGLLSVLNWLFDKTCDYGWGVGRALAYWAGQFVVIGTVFAAFAMNCSPASASGWLEVLKHGLLLSFANSHAFLRLASGDGWLHGSRSTIVNSCGADWLFSYIGLVQAVFGPVLLFLVLLTLRNRFRL